MLINREIPQLYEDQFKEILQELNTPISSVIEELQCGFSSYSGNRVIYYDAKCIIESGYAEISIACSVGNNAHNTPIEITCLDDFNKYMTNKYSLTDVSISNIRDCMIHQGIISTSPRKIFEFSGKCGELFSFFVTLESN